MKFEDIDVRLFRCIATMARQSGKTRTLSEGDCFVDWFTSELRIRFSHELSQGGDPFPLLHGQLKAYLAEENPPFVRGPWGHVELNGERVVLHSTKE